MPAKAKRIRKIATQDSLTSDRSTSQRPFAPGAVMLVTLNHPREKYWGSVIAVTPAGISLRGIDLNSFEDFARLLKAGEDVVPSAVFFPMHRVERMEMDSRN